ncbi:MAG: TonB-dependent receptor [Reichenbachiella sp.]
MKLTTLISLLSMFILNLGYAQSTQTVRGRILDQDTQIPLIGASVVVLNADPIIGAISDVNGDFRLTNIPIGRVSLKISYIGYEDRTMANILVGAGKESVLDIKLIESFEKLEEIIITASDNKAEVLNEMSIVSARSFSVDETKRFAGSFADPARMVSGFAGVANQPEGNNDIVVRGNSPKGILWRLEGVEIPNPNHFANEGSTGGPINALNSNMLSDSDFMSGAFAPEYGNALSGVFDMKLRKGNNENREYNVGISTLGLDLTAEGPFKEGYGGSYIANYRYSSLDLIDKANIVDFGGVPKYQDLSFNVFLPINKKHNISIFGLGGLSSIVADTQLEDDDTILGTATFDNYMGTMGITHNYLIDNKSFLRSNISVSGTGLHFEEDLPLDNPNEFYNAYNSDFNKTFVRLSTAYNYKFNSKHKMETGVILIRQNYNIRQNNWNFQTESMDNILDDEGFAYRSQAFTSWKYRMTENLTLISGLHFMYLDLNKSYSVEPRVAMRWKASEQSSFNVGVGLHSKMESISTYLYKQYNEDGSYYRPNEKLTASKAAHFIIGYDQSIGRNTHLKIEAYYQHLYQVPIEDADTSTYSLINVSDEYLNRPLVNEGTGRNYGLEMTLEQYLHKGFYYMASASVFNSLYTPMDGKERQTAYANNYIFNVLGGKEFKMGKAEKNRIFFVNGKVSLLGGKRYTPIDLQGSIDAGYQKRQEDQPFAAKSDDIFIMNLSIGIRRDKKNTTREFKIDVQNITNNKAIVNQYWVNGLDEVYEAEQLPMFPTISYSITF